MYLRNELIIAAIAVTAAIISGSAVTNALAISEQGTNHAQRPGHGVCNADAKIHEHQGLFSKTDVNFHKALEKNFGPPSNFVGPSSTCKNPA